MAPDSIVYANWRVWDQLAQQPAGWIWRTLVDSSLMHANSGNLAFLHQAFRAGKRNSANPSKHAEIKRALTSSRRFHLVFQHHQSPIHVGLKKRSSFQEHVKGTPFLFRSSTASVRACYGWRLSRKQIAQCNRRCVWEIARTNDM